MCRDSISYVTFRNGAAYTFVHSIIKFDLVVDVVVVVIFAAAKHKRREGASY